MKVSVKVPATIANIGCGFDCFGLALPIYNIITIEETVMPGSGIEINIFGEEDSEDLKSIPTDKNNIIYKAIDLLYTSTGQIPNELKINVKTTIPVAKGLGSSASVIVGGLLAANEFLGKPADLPVLLSIATEIEGHPDNITAAFLGGFTIAMQENDGSITYSKLEWPSDWKLTVCIPDYELSTEISRSVLPKEVPIKDAAFNLKRAALFVQAIHQHDSELLKLSLQDKLHQQYRCKLVPGLESIMQNLRHTQGVLGVTLAGAGPSILVISKNANINEIKEIVTNTWDNINVSSQVLTLPIETTGAVKI
jgi:homoserine kinase